MSAWFVKYREAFLITLGLLMSGAVAYVTGASSWGHIVHVGRTVSEPSAAWLPVAIDGMMINGTVMAAVDRFRGRVPRFWSVVSLWLGSLLTLAFNAASALGRGPWAVVIACMYAVALLVTVETIFHPSQRWLKSVLIERAAASAAATPETVQPVSEPVVPEPAATVPTTNGHGQSRRNGARPQSNGKPQGKPEGKPQGKPEGKPQGKPQGPRRSPARTNFTGQGVTDPDIDDAIKEFRDRDGQPKAIQATALFVEPSTDADPVIDAELVDSAVTENAQ
jgi:hypothetical protein